MLNSNQEIFFMATQKRIRRVENKLNSLISDFEKYQSCLLDLLVCGKMMSQYLMSQKKTSKKILSYANKWQKLTPLMARYFEDYNEYFSPQLKK
jgi:hypothetical protein